MTRKLLQVTLTPDLHAAVRACCREIDKPMAIWVRDLIRRELGSQHGKITRFSAIVDETMADDITALAEQLEVDESELFRRAMSLYIRAKRNEGDRIILLDPQGSYTELVGV